MDLDLFCICTFIWICLSIFIWICNMGLDLFCIHYIFVSHLYLYLNLQKVVTCEHSNEGRTTAIRVGSTPTLTLPHFALNPSKPKSPARHGEPVLRKNKIRRFGSLCKLSKTNVWFEKVKLTGMSVCFRRWRTSVSGWSLSLLRWYRPSRASQTQTPLEKNRENKDYFSNSSEINVWKPTFEYLSK